MRKDNVNPSAPVKYCAVCGRLISSHVRNYEERKYCSKTCSSTRLTELDRSIEDQFVKLATEKGQVECGEVQTIMSEQSGRQPLESVPEQSNEADAAAIQAAKTKAGQDEAAFRERVRRAARRVVVSGRDGQSFVCWSQGKVAEPSFAKGEWAVKHVKT